MDNKEGIVHDGNDAPETNKAVAGIRSRITVVCAECKRLKLKCDRRSPCSSCVKRETTARCIYSAAAAEKIDVQSLHNRVSALEDSWRAWTNTQPGSTPTAPLTGCGPPSGQPPPPQPPAALVATDDISSALVGLEDVSSLWAAHLGLDLSLLSLRPSSPEYDDDDDTDDSELERVRTVPLSHRTGVTSAHISLLPNRHTRALLWNVAEKVLGPHAGLSSHTRSRFEHMCSSIDSGSKWSTSLLALGTAGLAIGAHVGLEGSPAPGARALEALSHRALSPCANDTDALLAALLHAARGTLDGRARLRPTVWPDVCRAVGVARGMGLAVDMKGDEGVTEWRKRVWWEVYCADLYTADCAGQPPLIDDLTFSLALPKDVTDEERSEREKDDGAYFALKCRLAQLIKKLKRRLLDERPLSFEGANAIEHAVSEFMRELPPAWKLDMSGDAHGGGVLGEDETALMLQRCQLATAANSLILKAYYPFLTRNSPSAFASPHQAALACSSAAHALIHASLTAHRFLPRTRPYHFAQQLFGGAVVAASVAITSPTGLYANLALNDVRGALNVLRELDMVNGTGVEGLPSEAVRVIEVLVSKAESAMGVASSVPGALKRKRRETESGGDTDLGVGFELPFVGAAVVTCAPDEEHDHEHRHHSDVPPPASVPPPPAPHASPHPAPERTTAMGTTTTATPATTTTTASSTTSDPEPPKRDKPKVSPYPRIGVRVRSKPSKTNVGPIRTKNSPLSASESPVAQTLPSPVPSTVPSSNGVMPQQSAGGLAQPGPGGLAQQQQQQQQQPVPGGLQQPSNGPLSQMTVPHQPPLQVLTDAPAPYLPTGEYPTYGEYGQMPYLMNPPATPVGRDYQPEFYNGYDYRMDYKDGMNMREEIPVPVPDGGEGWYRHAPAGPPQTQPGQWNGNFEMPPAWNANR